MIGAQLLLLGIYLASAMVRTLRRRLPFTGFEVVQCPDLRWLIYPLLAAAAYKFLFQYFRQDRTIAMVISLALWGGAMLTLPRLLQSPKSGIPPA